MPERCPHCRENLAFKVEVQHMPATRLSPALAGVAGPVVGVTCMRCGWQGSPTDLLPGRESPARLPGDAHGIPERKVVGAGDRGLKTSHRAPLARQS